MSLKRTILAASALLLARTAPADTFVVRLLAGRQFSPATITVRTGDTVVWRNDDTMDHTSTSGTGGNPDGKWDSMNLAPAASFPYTFTVAGAFPYYCAYHGGMTGVVNVVAGGTIVNQAAGRVFSPASVTINVGETVIWHNIDTMAHTTTSGTGTPDGKFNSLNMDPGFTFAHTFAAAGTFPYYCDYHSGMVGDVVVQAAPPAAFVLKLARKNNDVLLSWTGAGATSTLRGIAKTLADLTTLNPVTGNSDTDASAVPPPPTLYFYGVR